MIEHSTFRDSNRHRTLFFLLIASLVTSAIHFIDNAFHLDIYPGPAWFTPSGVLLAWLPIPALAFIAYRRATRAWITLYSLLGSAGLAHFLPTHSHPIAIRCLVTVCAEAFTSVLLIAFAILTPPKSRA